MKDKQWKMGDTAWIIVQDPKHYDVFVQEVTIREKIDENTFFIEKTRRTCRHVEDLFSSYEEALNGLCEELKLELSFNRRHLRNTRELIRFLKENKS